MLKYKQNLRVEGNEVFSYSTHVATIDGGKLIVHGYWSSTTSKHINHVADVYGLTKVEADKPDKTNGAGILKMASTVAMMSEVFCNTQKEKNDWKLRMLKAVPGISIPDDFDSLPEKEKEQRLNKVIEFNK